MRTCKDALAAHLHRNVDLLDLKRLPTVMQAQVVNTGRRLYCKDPFQVELFETTVFSSYVYLNEERREILRDIEERGSIYG